MSKDHANNWSKPGLPLSEIEILWNRFKLEYPEAYQEMIEFRGDPSNPKDLVRAELCERKLFWFVAELIECGDISLPDNAMRDIHAGNLRAQIIRHAMSSECKFLLYKLG